MLSIVILANKDLLPLFFLHRIPAGMLHVADRYMLPHLKVGILYFVTLTVGTIE